MPDQIIKEIFDILRSENFPVIVGLVSGVLAIGLISVASLPKKLFNRHGSAYRLTERLYDSVSLRRLAIEDQGRDPEPSSDWRWPRSTMVAAD